MTGEFRAQQKMMLDFQLINLGNTIVNMWKLHCDFGIICNFSKKLWINLGASFYTEILNFYEKSSCSHFFLTSLKSWLIKPEKYWVFEEIGQNLKKSLYNVKYTSKLPKKVLYTDSTKINRPGHNIRMYWMNFQQPTAHVQ